MKRLLTITTFLFIALLGLGIESMAQRGRCVKCEIVANPGPCYVCVAAGRGETGGALCRTPSCSQCILDNPCNSFASAQQDEGVAIQFDQTTIKQIASQHPRFAATLALLNRHGGAISRQAKVYWAPVEINSREAEAMIDPASDESAPILAAYDKRNERTLRQMARRKKKPIVYEVSVEDIDSASRLVRVRAVNQAKSDTSPGQLELTVINDQGRPTILNWRVEQ